jgi:5-methylcytosine-specific restriction endonuclease McrA
MECDVVGCPTQAKRRGYCGRHYQRLLKHGSVTATKLHDVDLAGDRMCRHCGANLADKRSNAVYCSRACKAAGSHLRLRATPEGKAAERARNLARYAEEAEGRRRGAVDYYHRNRELRVQYAREWRKENPHRRREQAERRADLMIGNPGFCPFGAREWERLKRRFSGCCAHCGTRPDEPLQMDHVIPLSKGGRHAIANILPACPDCNRRKSDFLLAVWRYRTAARVVRP